MILAERTLRAIAAAIEADQGARFRGLQWKYMQQVPDAFSTDTFPFRSHLGASVIGGPCARANWLSFRWATLKQHSAKLLRLFNRGHLEEARMLALIELIGATVYNVTTDGKQLRISHAAGHAGGSVDGIAVGIPDLPPGFPCLTEFKTHGQNSFAKLQQSGVRKSKPQHYTQVQLYMGKLSLQVALYVGVNKNTDELYAELIPFDAIEYERGLKRFTDIVFSPAPPKRISESAAWFECRMCDEREACFFGKVHKTCRTCTQSVLIEGGWMCRSYNVRLTKEQQAVGCNQYNRIRW